ncbi:hypothetical protein HYS95_03780 [Candidatus Daviesbacteria bacterium]|nr:hypothetical protein [Candidatus Daviesbacteria bacterium]
MRSKWYELKPTAIELRQKGISLREVERILKIPKSTLSGWFKDVKLNHKQQEKLKTNFLKALIKARRKAVKWHNKQKESRLIIAKSEAEEILSKLNLEDNSIIELALSMLYMGEGAKNGRTAIGNSNPLILKFFINALKKIYGLDITKIKCELHLRADQNPETMKKFWSKELNIPLSSFASVSHDKRTTGRDVVILRYKED